ncbi:general stress protein [Sporosarcina aquimarina]|uniref:General stress protein n=1 Tax=Sporosarcina aquimarina TaxID=114975 RepID=A0ABU4FZZ1_9BACL|nr:general stress protein [Sporosarcina aquimarina]MDW0110277.1 general stress protein [Sporosarcina aquimarina]
MVEKFYVENAVQAKEKVEELVTKGYTHDDIYIFAHDKKRGSDINDALDTEEAGMKEQGFLDSMKNMFSSRGDELRSKMHGAGLTEDDAAAAESELDKGKLVVIANKN